MYNIPIIKVNNLDNIVYRGVPYMLDLSITAPSLTSQITETVPHDITSELGIGGTIHEFPVDKNEWYFDADGNVEISKFEISKVETDVNLLITGRKPVKYDVIVLFNEQEIQRYADVEEDSSHEISISSGLFSGFVDGTVTIQVKYGIDKILEKQYDLTLVNTEPNIIFGDIRNNKLDLTIVDDEDDLIKVSIKVNGKNYHPSDGGFTEYLSTPYFYSTRISGEHLIVDENDFVTPNNTISVTVVDQYGAETQMHKSFAGEYVGLMFVDEEGGFYSDDSNNYVDDANILREQYLGELRAGTRGNRKVTYLYNKTPFAMTNIQLKLITVGIPEGTEVKIAKDNVTGFENMSDSMLNFNDTRLDVGSKLPFYVQANTDILSLGGGYYYIDVIADPIE